MVALTSPRTASVTPADLDLIYREQFEYVWATLRRLGVAEADLEDVAHEVFVAVHRRLKDFDGTRAVRPWIFGIAMRVASRHRRGRQRRREVGDDQLAGLSHSAVAETTLERDDERRLVADALDRLNEEQRAVFVLHELEGQSIPEISVALGVSTNTLYSRLRLARERFVAEVRRLHDKRSLR